MADARNPAAPFSDIFAPMGHIGGQGRGQGRMGGCERCELPVQEPCCNLRSEQGRPSYGWRRVAISNGGRAIGRAKK